MHAHGTSASLAIGRWTSRLRLPSAAPRLRGRLQDVLADVIDTALEDALRRAGVGTDEIVCMRRVQASVQLAQRSSDRALAAHWSEAIVAAIQHALHGAASGAGGLDVVRYHHLADAWHDCSDGVARGDLRRQWAWRQVGVWPATPCGATPASQWAAALAAAPQFIVPVLASLARRARLAALARQLSAADWSMLAHAAARAHGLPPGFDGATTDGAGGDDDGDHDQDHDQDQAVVPLRALQPWIEAATAAPAAALALLALLVQNPAWPQRSEPTRRREWRRLRRTLTRAGVENERTGGATRRPPDAAGAPAGHAAPTVEHALAVAPRRAHSAWGGLLLLWHLVPAAGLLDDEPAPAAPAVRPLAWHLHRIACRLLPLLADDAAALAFAGLAPDDAPPEGEATPSEHAAIERAAQALRAALCTTLAEPAVNSDALLHRVCRREAGIVVFPGWIDVHFALAGVDTALRRQGLDLDPGWLPWLGVVVKFHYV